MEDSSEKLTSLLPALLAAQKDFSIAEKSSRNPHFKSKYADLTAILDAVMGPLNNNGLVLLQPPVTIDGKAYIKTLLLHASSGEYLSCLDEIITAKANDPQAKGSAISYTRRYSLQAFLGIRTADDDGNAAASQHSGSEPVSAPYRPAPLAPKAESTAQVVVAPVSSSPAAAPKPLNSANGFKKHKPAAPVETAVATPLAEEEWK